MKKNMILSRTKIAALASLGVLAMASMALADDATSGHSGLETMEQPQVEHIVTANPGFQYIAPAEVHGSDGVDISVLRFDVPLNYTIKTEPGDLRLGAFYEHSKYILTHNPNDNFNTLALSLLWKSMVDDNWGYFLYGAAGCSASSHADFEKGFTGMGGAGVRYVWSEKLSLGLGAAVASRLEDGPMVLPIIAYNWQIDDRWNLHGMDSVVLSYDVCGDKTFVVDLGIKYQRREYREDDDISLTDKMMTAELGATYNFTPKFGLRGYVGVAGGRSIEERQHSHKTDDFGDRNVDSAPFIGVRAFITF